jgi:hypothetical protein
VARSAQADFRVALDKAITQVALADALSAAAGAPTGVADDLLSIARHLALIQEEQCGGRWTDWKLLRLGPQPGQSCSPGGRDPLYDG